MENNTQISWERFLNPEILRSNLIVASLYITAFEMLKDTIISRIHDFYIIGFEDDKEIISSDYKTKVLSLNNSPLYASLEWLKQNDVIDDQDMKIFSDIKFCRNEIAHELSNFISQNPKIDPLPLFSKMNELLNKIEKWWIINVEVTTNPDLLEMDIDEQGVVPGKIIMIRLLLDIALGSEEESKFYYNQYIKHNQCKS